MSGGDRGERSARIEALDDERDERFVVLTGDHLDTQPDPELTRIVGEIAERMHVPMSMVSLVLRRTQFFRAQTGLGPGMDHVRSTARDASFCQFVVRDEAMLEVSDAKDDPSVPQELVERFGHRAYLGVPLRTGGKVVGSLCAVDTAPRRFTDEDRALLEACAVRASRRLDEMAASSDAAALVSPAIEPAFAELRNAMGPLLMNLSRAQVAAAEVGAVVRALEAATPEARRAIPELATLPDPRKLERDLVSGLGAMGSATVRMRRVIQALELAILAEREPATMGEVVAASLELSRHGTKLVGGAVERVSAPELALAVPRQSVILALAAAIALVVEAMTESGRRGGVEVSAPEARASETVARVSIRGVGLDGQGLDEPALQAVLGPLLSSIERHGLTARASGDAVTVDVPVLVD
jgi:GAF domain-containing protein